MTLLKLAKGAEMKLLKKQDTSQKSKEAKYQLKLQKSLKQQMKHCWFYWNITVTEVCIVAAAVVVLRALGVAVALVLGVVSLTTSVFTRQGIGWNNGQMHVSIDIFNNNSKMFFKYFQYFLL